MIRFLTTLFISAFIAAPALAQQVSPQQLVQKITDDVLAAVKSDKQLAAGDRQKAVKLAERYRRSGLQFSPEAMQILVSAPWPGNVRQLLNVVEQNDAMCKAQVIGPRIVQKALGDTAGVRTFAEARDEFVHSYLAQLLQVTGGNISRAAKLAGRNRSEFYKLLGRHGLKPRRNIGEGPVA